MDDIRTRRSHPVDRHVGRRLRELRLELRVSQEQLADKLGITFQQVQKYEKGVNRVSASKLFDVAAALGVDVGFFFHDLPTSDKAALVDGRDDPLVHSAATTGEAAEIDRLFLTMKRKQRRMVLDLARVLAGRGSNVSEECMATA